MAESSWPGPVAFWTWIVLVAISGTLLGWVLRARADERVLIAFLSLGVIATTILYHAYPELQSGIVFFSSAAAAAGTVYAALVAGQALRDTARAQRVANTLTLLNSLEESTFTARREKVRRQIDTNAQIDIGDAIALLNRMDDVATLVGFGAVEEQAVRASLWIWVKRDFEHLHPLVAGEHPHAFAEVSRLYARWACRHATYEAARKADFKYPSIRRR